MSQISCNVEMDAPDKIKYRIKDTKGRFIYILDSSNSSSFTF